MVQTVLKNQNFRFVLAAAVAAGLTCCSILVCASPLTQRRAQKALSQKSRVPPKPKVDYTKFSHTTHTVTQKLACDSCHKVPSRNWKEVRKGDAAFPDMAD